MKVGLAEGYYTEDGFTTRYPDYYSPQLPPGFQDLNTDEVLDFEDGDKTVWRATDGKYFLDYDKAKAYQDTLTVPELDEVLELLEKVKVLCETNKAKSPVLETIQDILSKINNDGGERLMAKYYDSTCW